MQLFITPEKRRRAKRYLWISACGLALLVLVVHEIAGENGYLARRQRRVQIETLRQEIEKLQQDNLRLNQQIKALRSDPHAIEELAREQLRLARPGEVIVTLPPAGQPAPPARDAASR